MTGLNELLTNAGDDAGEDIEGEWQTWNGGPGDFWVWGDLGGGQVDLHAALDENTPLVVCGTTVKDVNVSTTQSAVTKFNFNHGTRIRAVVTLTTATSSEIYVKVN